MQKILQVNVRLFIILKVEHLDLYPEYISKYMFLTRQILGKFVYDLTRTDNTHIKQIFKFSSFIITFFLPNESLCKHTHADII